MAGITLQQAQSQLDMWIAADQAVASAQSYEIAGRKLTRADAAEITNKIEFWAKKVNRLSSGNGGSRVRYGVPL